MPIRFCQFVRANKGVIDEWLDGFGAERDIVEGKLHGRLRLIRATPTVQKKWMKKLQGKADGIHEITLKYRNVQYRILGSYGPQKGDVTMLFAAIEHNDKLRPPNARTTAYERSLQINQPGKVVAYDS
jgi:hypothetical protein